MELYNHRHQPDSGDMPIAELVFLAAGSFGFYVAVRGIRSRLHYHGLTFVVALCFTLLCYVGYTGTGASYDEQVLDTYRALAPANAKDNAHPIARSFFAPIANLRRYFQVHKTGQAGRLIAKKYDAPRLRERQPGLDGARI
jgi:hypothetical protein